MMMVIELMTLFFFRVTRDDSTSDEKINKGWTGGKATVSSVSFPHSLNLYLSLTS